MTELVKQDKWYTWKPKSGRYKGRTLYVSLVISPQEDRYNAYGDVRAAILAFYSIKTGKLTMHKGQITQYQLDYNTNSFDVQYMIDQLEKVFDEYKPKWEEGRVIRDAKSLLLNETKRRF